jgi:hypothetical protein
MFTMQAFYAQLFSPDTRRPYWGFLARLTEATGSQLKALDSGWEWWG